MRPALLLVLAVALSGCFQLRSVVRLSADGSGTVEETVLMNSTLLLTTMGIAGMAEMDADAGPYDRAQLEAHAAELGENVRLASVEEIDVLFGAGYRAVYAFDDVEALRLSGDIASAFPPAVTSEMGMGGADPSPPITFGYAPGRLVVHMPRPDDGPVADGQTDPAQTDATPSPKKPGVGDAMPSTGGGGNLPDEDEFRQMARLMKDLRMTIRVELPRPIAETDARHAEAQALTLLDFDMGAFFSAPESYRLLEEIDPGGPEDLMATRLDEMSDLPGFTVEPGETVTVSF